MEGEQQPMYVRQASFSDDSGSAAVVVKFSHLSDLIVIPEGESAPDLSPQPANLAVLHIGDVIQVFDPNSRLDRRVMVVLRELKGRSMLCLTLCRHQCDVGRLTDHWRVCGPEATARAEMERVSPALRCILRPHEDRKKTYDLQPSITISLHDPFTVQHTVAVTLLGHVEPASMRHLKETHVEVYSRSILGPEAGTSQAHTDGTPPPDRTAPRKSSGQHDRNRSRTEEEQPRRRPSGRQPRGENRGHRDKGNNFLGFRK